MEMEIWELKFKVVAMSFMLRAIDELYPETKAAIVARATELASKILEEGKKK